MPKKNKKTDEKATDNAMNCVEDIKNDDYYKRITRSQALKDAYSEEQLRLNRNSILVACTPGSSKRSSTASQDSKKSKKK